MEESKEIQSIYSIFRVVIYVSLVVEFFEYACNPELLDTFAGVLTDLHERMGRWLIYQPGHLAYSKIATLLLVIITCIGTRNKKQIEFDARKMVFWPIRFRGKIGYRRQKNGLFVCKKTTKCTQNNTKRIKITRGQGCINNLRSRFARAL